MSVTPAQAGAPLDPGNRQDDGSVFIKTFPCAGCGAKLSYAPGTRNLKCEFCGTANTIAGSDERIEELDLDTFLKALEGNEETFEEEHVRCEKCGAEQNLGNALFASQCSFCGAPIVSKGYAHRRIKPRSLVPFQVDRKRAQEEFRRWVRGLWLAPGELKRYAQSDAGVTGMYIPFWTYDCRTSSDYRGERGEDYYTNETVTTRDGAGREVTRMQRVKHTNWSPASGHVDCFHDDVLVMASQSLPRELRGATAEWNLKALVPYQPEFISGYRAEAYQVGLKEGFPMAKERIDARVHELVREDIGGDQQRVDNIATRYSDIKFKHVLLPVWMSAYRYRDKTFRFLVNGQTGEVAGESPLSWQKVTLVVVAVLIVAFLIVVFGSSGSRAADLADPPAASGGPRAGPRATQQLHDEIAAMDKVLFTAVFDTCDTATLAKVVTEDFEMFHDKGGRSATSGADFVKSIEGMCARQKTGEDYRARRELVPGSMKVYPLHNYGAVQVGEHRFYQLLPGKPEKLVEISLFTQVWKKDEKGWRLARVISYDHRLTP